MTAPRRIAIATVAALLLLSAVAIAKAITTNIYLARTTFGPTSAPYVAMRLQNGHHLAIYISTHDARDKSRCYGACASTFVPLIARSKINVWNGTRRKLLGVINRGHGLKQVTYNHHPLYTNPYDSPGVATEDGCQLFHGSWYVVDRNGHPDKRFNVACGY